MERLSSTSELSIIRCPRDPCGTVSPAATTGVRSYPCSALRPPPIPATDRAPVRPTHIHTGLVADSVAGPCRRALPRRRRPASMPAAAVCAVLKTVARSTYDGGDTAPSPVAHCRYESPGRHAPACAPHVAARSARSHKNRESMAISACLSATDSATTWQEITGPGHAPQSYFRDAEPRRGGER